MSSEIQFNNVLHLCLLFILGYLLYCCLSKIAKIEGMTANGKIYYQLRGVNTDNSGYRIGSTHILTVQPTSEINKATTLFSANQPERDLTYVDGDIVQLNMSPVSVPEYNYVNKVSNIEYLSDEINKPLVRYGYVPTKNNPTDLQTHQRTKNKDYYLGSLLVADKEPENLMKKEMKVGEENKIIIDYSSRLMIHEQKGDFGVNGSIRKSGKKYLYTKESKDDPYAESKGMDKAKYAYLFQMPKSGLGHMLFLTDDEYLTITQIESVKKRVVKLELEIMGNNSYRMIKKYD